jgi:hypothetical protein
VAACLPRQHAAAADGQLRLLFVKVQQQQRASSAAKLIVLCRCSCRNVDHIIGKRPFTWCGMNKMLRTVGFAALVLYLIGWIIALIGLALGQHWCKDHLSLFGALPAGSLNYTLLAHEPGDKCRKLYRCAHAPQLHLLQVSHNVCAQLAVHARTLLTFALLSGSVERQCTASAPSFRSRS